MTESDDMLVGREFAAYREALAPAVRPAGPAAVRATVRRRRRHTVAASAGALVLAVAVPVAGPAALDRHPTPPAPTPTAAPTPSATTPSPTPPAPAPTTASPTPAAPDGRISREQLLAARVDLPAWRWYVPKTCTTRDVRLRAGETGDSVPVLFGNPRYGDVDGDGAVETVALVACRQGEAHAKQVVAFDRDEAGRIRTMGRVVDTYEGVHDITDFAVGSDGPVRVEVGDIQPCCATPRYWQRKQWRTYAWTGERFRQTAGPTEFGPDTRLTDLILTGGELVLGPVDENGKRPGSLTLTVVNRGPLDVPQLGFSQLESIGVPDGGAWSACRTDTTSYWGSCLMKGLRVGERRTFTFRFLVDPAGPGMAMSAQVLHYDTQGRYWEDLTPKDNVVTVRMPS